jgi:hypothetical protein
MSRSAATVTLAFLLAVPAVAATRMTYDIHGTPTAIEWAPTAFPLPYTVDQRLAQLDSEAPAIIDRAFAAWAAIPDAQLAFVSRGTTSGSLARTAGGVTISLADDLFRDQGALAMTTYTFDDDGRYVDAAIQIDPSLFRGSWNAQMAIEHEVGHVLGLDHSGVLSAIMYPYVASGASAPLFDSDDRIAIATTYPKTNPTLGGATLEGRVVGDNGGIFGAQVVALNTRGEPVATALTDASGEFTIAGVPEGRYRLYAEPLDGPMLPDSLQGTWRTAKAGVFPTEFFDGGAIDVANGRVYGNLMLRASGVAQLNPRWVGSSKPDANAVSLSSAPIGVKAGDTVRLSVGGDGFTSGMTQFEITNPAFRRVSDFSWQSNYMSATFTVDRDAAPGSAVILVTSGRETATLTGALRIEGLTKSRSVRH